MNWLAADLPTEFASFRQYCELIFRGPFADKDEAARVTYILLWVGQEGLRMYNTWDLSDADSKKVDVIWGSFRALIEPKANFRLSRFNLHKFRQSASEPSQALGSQGDPAHNPGQGDEAINKPSTSCASMKTATMMTHSNTWNLTVSQTMTGETRSSRHFISLCAMGPESVMRV